MRPTESKLVRHRKMTIVDSDSGANDHDSETPGPGVRAKDFILFNLSLSSTIPSPLSLPAYRL